MPMGPITLYDVVGLDTAFYAGRVLCTMPSLIEFWCRPWCRR